MKIVVAGGRSKADFLIGSLLEKKHEVTVINDEEAYCWYLSEKYNIPVVVGNPCKRYVLEEAEIDHADILIALRPGDPDNLAICQTAKKNIPCETGSGNRFQSQKCFCLQKARCKYGHIRNVYDCKDY